MSPELKAKPLTDYAERRRWQEAARARGEAPECGRYACARRANPAWTNSGTPLLYCGACAAIINTSSRTTLGYDLCTPEPGGTDGQNR